MIINLDSSKLFTEDPDIRFAKNYDLPRGVWSEIWKRYVLLEYSLTELQAFYEVKTNRTTTVQSIRRWIWRTEVYARAKSARKLGARAVSSEYFGDKEEELLKELTKNISKNKSKDVRVLV